MALATRFVAVWVETFADVTVAWATCGVSPPASGARLVNPAERGPRRHELTLPPQHGVTMCVALLTLTAAQPGSRCSSHTGWPPAPAAACLVHLPGLTVWPKVIWGTLAGVAMEGTGLSGTCGLVLTWVQITHISTVVTIVT